jgi:hypothetical protein
MSGTHKQGQGFGSGTVPHTTRRLVIETNQSPSISLTDLILPAPAEGSPSPGALSEQARADLEAARAAGYEVSVLKKEIGEGTTTVVLFGESHSLNTDSELELANNVRKHFSTFALEGYDPKKYIGGTLHYRTLESRRAKASKELALNNKGSMDLTVEHANQVTRVLIRIQSDVIEQLNRGESRIKLNAKKYDTSQEIFDEAAETFRQLLEEHLNSNSKDQSPEQKPARKKIHSLEQNHKPNALEQLHTINNAFSTLFDRFLGSTMLVAAAALTTSTVAVALYPSAELALTQTISAWTLAAAGTLFALDCIFSSSPARKITQSIEAKVEEHFHARREETMALEINRIVASQELSRPVLVQTGKNHVTPIKERLIKEYGWIAENGELYDPPPSTQGNQQCE